MKVKSLIATLRGIDYWIISPMEWLLASGHVNNKGKDMGSSCRVKNKKIDYVEVQEPNGKPTMYIYVK